MELHEFYIKLDGKNDNNNNDTNSIETKNKKSIRGNLKIYINR